jgi:hypothetical protein
MTVAGGRKHNATGRSSGKLYVKSRQKIEGQFVPHRLAMLESAAWRALSFTARRILDRIEIEHMGHGGVENGRLPVTYDDLERYGIRRKSISGGLFELAALGFLEITQRGRMAAAEFHVPSKYRLTYVLTFDPAGAPTDEWSKFASDQEALDALWARPRKNRVIGKAVAGGRATALPVGAPGRRIEREGDWRSLASLAVAVLPSQDIDRGGENAPGTVGAKTPPEPLRHRGENAPGPRGENAPGKMISGQRQFFIRNAVSGNGGANG